MGMMRRKDILMRAVDECMSEMYSKAQPVGDWNQLCEDAKNGKIGPEERVYDRHYLSSEEFKYILQKYKDMYRINEEWTGNIEVLEEYLNEGGTKDKWIPEHTDENNLTHPGYKGYEKVPPIVDQIKTYLSDKVYDKDLLARYSEDITKIVMESIAHCKKFYRFDREDSEFSFAVALGASPTCNPETVKKWWKENKGIDVDITERNPLLFWEYDEYGDEIDEIMREEYGDDWVKYFDDKWKLELEERERKKQEIIAEIEAKNAEQTDTVNEN